MSSILLDADDQQARRNVFVLIAAQAVLGAQLSMIFGMAGLIGLKLAPNPSLATLPISLLVLGSMLTAAPLSAFMQRRGRKLGFMLGAMGGAFGAIVAAVGLWASSFTLLCLGAFFSGIYMSAQGFFRFAAADHASDTFRPKAISWVMAGGVLGAVTGAQLMKSTSMILAVPFMGAYLAIAALNILGAFIFIALVDKGSPAQALSAPDADVKSADTPPMRSWRALLGSPGIAVAVLCATTAYALMNLVMTSAPLAIIGVGHSISHVADVLGVHVMAMYLPSLFTGHLIARFGALKIIALGLVGLALAGGVSLSGVGLGHFFLSMMLLGLSWNFAFVGATALLTQMQRPHERGRLQGMNDSIVFGGVVVASLFSGGLMNYLGGSALIGWNLVNLAMIPFLVLAAVALGLLYRFNRKEALSAS